MNMINENEVKQMELYPDVRDGLISVQRKILWSFRTRPQKELNQFVKSAKIVGYVMGHFYPYNADCIYKGLVNMVQLTEKNPLVYGQGNFGSRTDRNSYAAMRFTEVKISCFGRAMLDGVEKNAVPLYDNFNGTFKEPCYLPSMFPNLLVNGFNGERASVPPHDFSDVIACVQNCCDAAPQMRHPLLGESRSFPVWTGEKVEELSFAQILGMWVDHRIECLRKILVWDVEEIKKKLHCLKAKKIFLQDIPVNIKRLKKFKDFQEFGSSMGFDEEQNKYLKKLSFLDIAASDVESEISLAESKLAELRKKLDSREVLLRIIVEQLETLANLPRAKQKKFRC